MNKTTVTILFILSLSTILTGAGCSKSPPPATPVAHVTDEEVTDHVKTSLHQNNLTKGYYITVVTLKGDVRLTGELDNQAQIDEAIKVALASDGAHTIHNELTIKK
jgi:osmotically-inducible protein OsmY